MEYEERMVALVFASVALLWLFREDLGPLPGWTAVFNDRKKIDDGTVAMIGGCCRRCIHHIPS